MASIQPVILNPDPIKLEVTSGKIINAISPTIDAERKDDGVELTIKDYRGEEKIMVYDGTYNLTEEDKEEISNLVTNEMDDMLDVVHDEVVH